MAERACSDGVSVGVWLRLVHLTARLHAPQLLPALEAAAQGGMDEIAQLVSEEASKGEGALGPQAAGGRGGGHSAAALSGVESVRSVLERGVTACGLHVSEGARMWDAYEATEMGLLAMIQQGGGAGGAAARGAAGGSPAADAQRSRLHRFWRRRLAVPNSGLEAAYGRYVEWERGEQGRGAAGVGAGQRGGGGASGAAEDADRLHRTARAAFDARRPFEVRVAAAAAAAGAPVVTDPWGGSGGGGVGGEWGAWEAYLRFEAGPVGGGDAWRVRMLYERMLTPAADAWGRAEEVAAGAVCAGSSQAAHGAVTAEEEESAAAAAATGSVPDSADAAAAAVAAFAAADDAAAQAAAAAASTGTGAAGSLPPGGPSGADGQGAVSAAVPDAHAAPGHGTAGDATGAPVSGEPDADAPFSDAPIPDTPISGATVDASAVSSLPLCARPAAWHRYILFLATELPAPGLRLEATGRAVRCCPGDAWVWVERLRAMEEGGAAPADVQATFEAGLGHIGGGGGPLSLLQAAGTEYDPAAAPDRLPLPHGGYTCDHMWLLHAYSEYHARRIRHAQAQAGVQPAAHTAPAPSPGLPAAPDPTAPVGLHSDASIPVPPPLISSARAARDAVLAYEVAYLPGLDPKCGLLRLWAAAEAHGAGDAAQARMLMEGAVARCGGGASVWVEFALMEARVERTAAVQGGGGGVPPFERCRKVFRRAVGVVHTPEHAHALHAAWLEFEAREGTVSSLRAAEARVASHRAQLGRRYEKEEQAAAGRAEAAAARAAAEAERQVAADVEKQKKKADKRREKRAAAKRGGGAGGGEEAGGEAGETGASPAGGIESEAGVSPGGGDGGWPQTSGLGGKRKADAAGMPGGGRVAARGAGGKGAAGVDESADAPATAPQPKKARPSLMAPRANSSAASRLVPRATRPGAPPPRPPQQGRGGARAPAQTGSPAPAKAEAPATAGVASGSASVPGSTGAPAALRPPAMR